MTSQGENEGVTHWISRLESLRERQNIANGEKIDDKDMITKLPFYSNEQNSEITRREMGTQDLEKLKDVLRY
ncbi:hypothetical protein HDV02_004137, partial [Globomyces sp. JEL0801]